ncbi:hypothetical protein FF2_018976 [Malus domestica]
MFPFSQSLFSSAGKMEIKGVVVEEVLVEFLNVFFRGGLTLTLNVSKARLSKNVFRSRFDGYPERAALMGIPDAEVSKMVVISRMVGPTGPRGRTMVLVAEHQKHRAARRSSLSRTTSIDERRMAS